MDQPIDSTNSPYHLSAFPNLIPHLNRQYFTGCHRSWNDINFTNDENLDRMNLLNPSFPFYPIIQDADPNSSFFAEGNRIREECARSWNTTATRPTFDGSLQESSRSLRSQAYLDRFVSSNSTNISPNPHLEARRREDTEVCFSEYPTFANACSSSAKTTNVLLKPRKKVVPTLIPRGVPLVTRDVSLINEPASRRLSSPSPIRESPVATPVVLPPHQIHIIQSQLTQRSYHNHENTPTLSSSQTTVSTVSSGRLLQRSTNSSPRDHLNVSNETADDVLFYSSNDTPFLACSTETENFTDFHDSLNTTSLYDSSRLVPSPAMDLSFAVSTSGSPEKHAVEQISSQVFLKPTSLTWTQEKSPNLDKNSIRANNNNMLFCAESRCTLKFTSTRDLSLHYATVHRFECSLCHRHAGLLSSFHLERHLLEEHDSFFLAQAEKQPMYVCLLEECSQVFKTAFVRDQHCITAHHFPQNFCFANKNSRGRLKVQNGRLKVQNRSPTCGTVMRDSDKELKS